jgi:hypothetical protein
VRRKESERKVAERKRRARAPPPCSHLLLRHFLYSPPGCGPPPSAPETRASGSRSAPVGVRSVRGARVSACGREAPTRRSSKNRRGARGSLCSPYASFLPSAGAGRWRARPSGTALRPSGRTRSGRWGMGWERGRGVSEREGSSLPPFVSARRRVHPRSLSLIPARPTPRPLNARRDLAVEVHSLQAGQGARPAHGG